MTAKITKGQERYCQEVAKERYPITLKKRIAAFKRSGFREKTDEAIKKKVKTFQANELIEARIKELREAKHGRPTDYKPEYCEEIIEFFSRQPFEFVKVKDDEGKEVVATNKNGAPILMPCELPTKEGFAISIGNHVNTLLDWAKKHPVSIHRTTTAHEPSNNVLILFKVSLIDPL